MKKKRLISIALSLILCALLNVSVFAAEHPARLIDGADLLTEDEEKEVLSELDRISEAYPADVVIVTVNTTDGKSPMEFADDYFDYNGYGQGNERSGVLLLVDMGDREMWISTSGKCIDAINDHDIESILDAIEFDMHNGYYADAFAGFAEECEYYIDVEINGKPTNYFVLIIASLITGLVVALIATGVMKGKLKSVRSKSEAKDYLKAGSLNVTRSSDMYLYRTVMREKLPEKDSSTHRSSSGRSHGGGGRGF